MPSSSPGPRQPLQALEGVKGLGGGVGGGKQIWTKQTTSVYMYIYIYRESQEAGNQQLLEKKTFSMLTKTGIISIIHISTVKVFMVM